jgi:hypothetical protein
MDDTNRLRFNPKVMNPGKNERTPYQGNPDPSRRELAAEGYETLIKADPTRPWAFEDRETLAGDAEIDISQVRRS